MCQLRKNPGRIHHATRKSACRDPIGFPDSKLNYFETEAGRWFSAMPKHVARAEK